MTEDEKNIRILLGFFITAYLNLHMDGLANTEGCRAAMLGAGMACKMLNIKELSVAQAQRLIEEAMKSMFGGEITDAILGLFDNDLMP